MSGTVAVIPIDKPSFTNFFSYQASQNGMSENIFEPEFIHLFGRRKIRFKHFTEQLSTLLKNNLNFLDTRGPVYIVLNIRGSYLSHSLIGILQCLNATVVVLSINHHNSLKIIPITLILLLLPYNNIRTRIHYFPVISSTMTSGRPEVRMGGPQVPTPGET